ncbi:hypothetical protein ATL51_2793 [Pseudonocardia alni]|uniref:Uncharacterized protein n=1 Tax=Pseudonocardia alni TaxID=33907 RepID=A0AA44UPF2_PSEA5|nr:hypothetical protein ATL51_2793 [Pseudonocardia alni]
MRVERPTRPVLQIALWTAAAAGALLLGLTAVGSIGSDLAGTQTQPLSAEQVDARLAQQAATAAPPAPAPVPTTAPASAPPAVVQAGTAGNILVRCDGAAPRIVSVNPAQGWEREDDTDIGPAEVVFDGDDVPDVRVTLSCAGGVPTGRVATVPED